MNRSPWACRPGSTGTWASASRCSRTAKPVLAVMSASVSMMFGFSFRWLSGTALHQRVLVPGEARGPRGGLDGVLDVRRDGEAVLAAGAVPFGASVGAPE